MRERERESESVCVCVRESERERERERERDYFLSNQTACVVLFLFRPAIIAIKSVRIKHTFICL